VEHCQNLRVLWIINAFDIIYISNPTLPAASDTVPTTTGLANINQLVVNITIDQQALSRVFRHARNDPVTWPNAPTINITGVPELIVEYYTVNPLQKIPPVLSYKYYSIVNYLTTNTSQALPAILMLTSHLELFKLVNHRILKEFYPSTLITKLLIMVVVNVFK